MEGSRPINQVDRGLVDEFIRTGDESAFRQLYRLHTPALYMLALRLAAGSEADAEDAVQETWIRACKTLSKFEWRSSLKTWLSGILINRVREMGRERRALGEEQLADDYSPGIFPRPGEKVDLEQAITRLPAGCRHVLVLHDVEGYTHEEISGLLDISAGTSKSQLSYARRSVRAMFQTERQ
jgi:RNA polymerase sigma-70 factor (ECF subfamily)